VQAVGIWASMGAVMGAGGPVLGGWLIDTVACRSIFLLNIPFAAGAIGLALVFVRDAPKDEQEGWWLRRCSVASLGWPASFDCGLPYRGCPVSAALR
jgi:MFS family permease